MKLDELLYRPGLLQGQRILITGGDSDLGRVMVAACLLLGSRDAYMRSSCRRAQENCLCLWVALPLHDRARGHA